MDWLAWQREGGASEVRAARFQVRGGVTEWHLVGRGENWTSLVESYLHARQHWGLGSGSAVFHRAFVADWREADLLALTPGRPPGGLGGALSVVQQPGIPDARPALYGYHVDDGGAPHDGSATIHSPLGGVVLERGAVRHLWLLGVSNAAPDTAAEQTSRCFDTLANWLTPHGATLERDVQRTWVYVSDIDRDYPSVNAARRDHFTTQGLGADTHFIASTGIGGGCGAPGARVGLEVYAVTGLEREQRHFVHAPSHLGPASAYGATFERGVILSYGDRRHVLLSGTAAIDPSGTTLHVGDPARQTERTLENIGALLDAAGAQWTDLSHAVIYLREAAHYADVERVVRAQLPELPQVYVQAPVCRPEWLVEIECAATIAATEPRWAAF